MNKTVLAMASALTLATPAAAQQFDLVCEGEAQTPPAPEKRPDKFRVAVDLERYEWCLEGCTAPKRITELTPEHIILERSSNILTPLMFRISRVDGGYGRMDGSAMLISHGRCERAEFTPFPARIF